MQTTCLLLPGQYASFLFGIRTQKADDFLAILLNECCQRYAHVRAVGVGKGIARLHAHSFIPAICRIGPGEVVERIK